MASGSWQAGWQKKPKHSTVVTMDHPPWSVWTITSSVELQTTSKLQMIPCIKLNGMYPVYPRYNYRLPKDD